MALADELTPEQARLTAASLDCLTCRELHKKWAALFGTVCYSRSRAFLIDRIRWKLELAQRGGHSERALRRMKELQDVQVLRHQPRCKDRLAENGRAASFPAKITRVYKGRTHVVFPTENGRFVYNGEFYGSLTEVAWKIAGYQVSGNRFFGLPCKARAAKKGGSLR